MLQAVPSFGLILEGVAQLMEFFPTYLHDLEHRLSGNPVEKALVIRDAGGRDPAEVEHDMAQKIRDRHYTIPRGIQCFAVRRTMETWLLADIEAINAAARSRGGRAVAAVQGTLEDVVDPKERLRRVLSKRGSPTSPKSAKR